MRSLNHCRRCNLGKKNRVRYSKEAKKALLCWLFSVQEKENPSAYSLFCIERFAPAGLQLMEYTQNVGPIQPRQVPVFRVSRPSTASSHGYIPDPLSVHPPSQPFKAFLIISLLEFLSFTAGGKAFLPLGSSSFAFLPFAVTGQRIICLLRRKCSHSASVQA